MSDEDSLYPPCVLFGATIASGAVSAGDIARIGAVETIGLCLVGYAITALAWRLFAKTSFWTGLVRADKGSRR